MKIIELKCDNCGISFIKNFREHKRQVKRGRVEFFCTRSCAAIKNNINSPREGNLENLKANNRADEFSPFKRFISKSKYRGKIKRFGFNLTSEYLKLLWEEQKGICPFTGWNLVLPTNTNKSWDSVNPENASLDRIDNTKGYIVGNVRFVAYIANIGRQSFTDQQLINFCKAVAAK